MTPDEEIVEQYLGEGGLLSRSIPAYEFRPQQLEMSRSVARCLESGGGLLVEAGTGVGKSLAYLVPAVLWAVRHNRKVVVSTYTKTLQQQILHHDIPLLRDRLGLEFRHSLCLGHENYLSLRRLKRAGQAGLFTGEEEESQFRRIFEWAGQTQTGIRADLPFEPLPSVWEDLGRQKDLCLGKNCETHGSCFYFKERRRWFGAHLLVVNHHLFFANVASRGGVLPRFDAVIFDEAHNIEEVATSFLGLEISNSSLFYFLDRLYNVKTRRGLLARLDHPVPLHLFRLAGTVRKAAEDFYQQLFEAYGRKDRTLRFYKPPLIENLIHAPLQDLYESLKDLGHVLESEEDRIETAAAAQRCFEFNNALNAILNQHLDGYVYWLELVARKRFTRAVLCGVPIRIAGELKAQVFDKMDRVVLTSATLATRNNFNFIKNRIGYEPREESALGSPFDYERRALLYVAADLPEPGEEEERYLPALSDRVRALISASGGRAFVLFTSYELMHRVYRDLSTGVHPFPILRQGDLPTPRLIERFKETPSVILGTSSFWQGVDIPGDSLLSVIITKLPFDVPNEPLTEARLEELRQNGGNPFREYQIPRAVIQLKQGFGRLIRNKTDSGVVSILDSRVARRGYGKQFLDSLPPCRTTEDLSEVGEFFNRLDSASRQAS